MRSGCQLWLCVREIEKRSTAQQYRHLGQGLPARKEQCHPRSREQSISTENYNCIPQHEANYPKDTYFFPDDRNESLGHAQIFKFSQLIEVNLHQLAHNSIAKELVIYPTLKRNLFLDNSIRVENGCSQYQEVPPNPRICGSQWVTDLIGEKEKDDVVKLEESLIMAGSKELAVSFGKTESFTPMRSHPGGPNKPPFETVVSLMLIS